jgi:hypothetical protein
MMKTSLRLLAVAAIASVSPVALATAIFALTTSNELMVVNAEVPQEILSIQPVTGLTAGENLLGIDGRPSNGELYAVSDNDRLFIINPNTAVATLVGSLTADPADATAPFTGLSGVRFSIDFNPVADRLRIVSDLEQNLRVNVGTGLVTTDTPLAYDTDTDGAGPDTGDVNAGANPSIAGIAYSNNVVNGVGTTLYGIDDQTFQIVVQNPPNNGTLLSNAPFGLPNATHVGLDIAPDGITWVAGKHDVPTHPTEYILATLDPTTGDGESHGVIGDGTIPIRDIAVATSVAFSAPHYAVGEGGTTATITVKREGFLNTSVSVQYSTFSDTASAAADYTTATGTLTFTANEESKTFQVTIKDDALPEEDEHIGLLLSNVAGPAVLGPPSIATLRINANDRPDVTGPLVEFIGLTGPSRGITGAVVHFNEDMDLATVQDVNNYKLVVFPRTGGSQVKTFTSAVYDPVERRVELGLAPFEQTEFKKMAISVNGKPAKGSRSKGVSDAAGNLLDGDGNRRPGGNAVQFFKVFSNTTLKFVDRDGDRVTLELTGGGRLDGVIPLGGPASQHTQFWIVQPIALQTTLAGTVLRSPKGDGIIVIAEIIGLDKKEFSPIVSNPAFRVNTLTFSSNATGLR